MERDRMRAPVLIRVSSMDDVTGIETLTSSHGGSEVAKIIETSFMALTAFDATCMDVIGFLSLSHAPAAPAGVEDPQTSVQWGEAEALAIKLTPPRIAWISSLFFAPGRGDVPEALLARAFALDPDVDALGAVTAPATPARAKAGVFLPPGLEGLASTVSRSAVLGVGLVLTRRADVLPRPSVRVAQQPDFDDLKPIIEDTVAWCPALAQLPVAPEDADADFALAQLIAQQDDKNKVIVAEVPGRGVVGMLSASSEVDLRLLYEHFDLDAFDWLMEPEGYDALRDAASRAVQDRQYPRLVPTRSETAEQRGAAGEQEMAGAREAPKGPLRGVQSTEHAGQLVGELSVITEGSADFSSGSPPRVSKDFSAVAREESAGGGAGEEEAAEMSPEEEAAAVRGSMVDMCARGEAAEASAVAVTMLCIRAGWEHVGLDLLRGLFAAFPGKMYAAVTLPHESNQPALLDMFSRVQPMPGVMFPEVLFCFHKDGLTGGFVVREAVAGDEAGAQMLTEGLPTQDDIMTSFTEAVRDKKGASGVFVAECKGEVVGLATLIGEVDLGALSALYRLDELLASQHHKAYGHAEVDMVVLSPVFTWRTRHFLRECMRLMGKTCLYYALPKKEPPQEVIADFFQVSTIREPPEISLPPFGLFVHPARLSHHVPARVNSRIVVVGASETGLSAIEGLLTSKEMRFEGITLISPGGNTLGSPLGTSWVDRIALEGSVTVLEGLVTGIDRDQRTVALEDGALVPYDTLVLAAGKQDLQLEELGLGSGGSRPPIITFEELRMSLDPEVGREIAQSASPGLPVTVVGNTPEAFAALELFQQCGVPAESLLHVTEDAGLSQLVRLAGREAGIDLLGHIQQKAAATGSSWQLTGVAEHSETSVTIDMACLERQGTDTASQGSVLAAERVQARLVVLCGRGSVDPSMAACLEGSSLVFDGRLVVDGAFRTNDSTVYGAGPLARFSSRYGEGINMDYMCSLEVGGHLARSLRSHFSKVTHRLPPSAGAEGPDPTDDMEAPSSIPLMLSARRFSVVSPEGRVLVFAGDPASFGVACDADVLEGAWAPAPDQVLLRSGTSVVQRGSPLVRLLLNANQVISSVVYVGPVGEFGRRAHRLVGLPVTYLGNLVSEYANGRVDDLYHYLTQDWAQALYHEAFVELRGELLGALVGRMDLGQHESKGLDGTGKAQAQEALLAMLASHSATMPAYKVA